VIVERFHHDHLKQLRLQESQAWMQPLIERADYGPALSLAGPAFSAFADGRLLGCGGCIEYGKHRAEIWALLDKDIGAHMRAVTRVVNGWLSVCPYPRVEANVATDFAAGLRWIKLLGFEQEGGEKLKFLADGRSALGFVRFP
jgi:hypothetical protein